MNGQYYLSSAGERWPANLAGAVARFDFEAGLNRASKLQVTLNNDAFELQDHPLLGEAQELTAQFGGDSTIRRSYRIHQVCGTRLLTVPATGPGADLGDNQRWRVFGNATYGEIAAQIARERSLDFDVASDPVRRLQVTQAGETDGRFLARIAGEIGWDFWVDNRTLRFRPPDYTARPVATLARGTDLVRFDPQERTLMAAGQVMVRSFDLATKSFMEVTIDEANSARAVLGPGAILSQAGTSVDWTPAQDSAAIMAMARGAYEARERTAVVVDFQTAGDRGDIRLMPGAIVEIRDYGARWDGLYRIAIARHQFSGPNYTVSGRMYRNAGGLIGAVPAATGPVNTKRADAQPFATVIVVDLTTGQQRKEEIR